MWNFENNRTGKYECHYSRYIASWTNMCVRRGRLPFFDEEFMSWLRSENVPENDIINIREMAKCGKMELEQKAKIYI